METLKIFCCLTNFLVFAVLYLKMVESIDQMHDSSFFSYQFIEMSLMMSSIQSLDTNSCFNLYFNNHKCLLKILNELLILSKVVAMLIFTTFTDFGDF